ncbi:putative ABC transporter ATP-binding protein [Dietzia timorensis]|uniref:Putative ABC transporter ATP-binding protein n=2 Tax=Dietzia timorensis TaxID=499555 RepID=A0A173LGT7_9ACTN|nr:putative ABC transporter ATP-binding protein [Dietzia timorensis]
MSAASSPSIIAENLGMRYGTTTVFEGLNLKVLPGRILVLAGPSGAGKTTLLNLLSGLDSATAGRVNAPGRTQRGFVFQDYNLLESLSAWDNALLSGRLLGKRVNKAAARATFAELGLDGLERRLPHELSGGQQQRVAVARVLIARVPFIFADEPTGALDARSADIVLRNLRGAADRGATVVLVSHSPEGLSCADDIVEIGGGR